jgi:hypothetical protein
MEARLEQIGQPETETQKDHQRRSGYHYSKNTFLTLATEVEKKVPVVLFLFHRRIQTFQHSNAQSPKDYRIIQLF